jgi:phospholipase/carboxylesterase
MEALRDHLLDAEVLQTAPHAFLLPRRNGPRPRTPLSVPHLQMNQWPPADMLGALAELGLRLEHVRPKESRMATRGTCALWLPDLYADGPRQAFIDHNEFCHLHPVPEGSVHLTLPNMLRDYVIELGWAEQHPAVRSGAMPESLVTVYAPRNCQDLGIVAQLIRFSWQFARGLPYRLTELQERTP